MKKGRIEVVEEKWIDRRSVGWVGGCMGGWFIPPALA